MNIFFICDLSRSKGIYLYHLVGLSDFTDTILQIDLDHYVIIDTISEDLDQCVKSIDWVCKHTINRTILNLITRYL